MPKAITSSAVIALLIGMGYLSRRLEILRFLGAGAAPIAVLLLLLGFLRLVFGLSRGSFYLLSVGSVFGSLAFFGIPFIELVIGTEEAVRLAVSMIAAVAPFTVGLVLVLLELYGMEGVPLSRAVADVLLRFTRNPLIISLVAGVALSLVGAELPLFLHRAAGLLGRRPCRWPCFPWVSFCTAVRTGGCSARWGSPP